MQSLLQAAPVALCAALLVRKVMCRQAGKCRNSPAEQELLHRRHAQSSAQADSGAPGDAGGVHQDTIVSAGDCPGWVMAGENRTTLRKAAVMADWIRPCVVHLPTQGTSDQIQQYVLDVEREIEALTWEGTGSFAVQT